MPSADRYVPRFIWKNISFYYAHQSSQGGKAGSFNSVSTSLDELFAEVAPRYWPIGGRDVKQKSGKPVCGEQASLLPSIRWPI